MPGIIDIHTHYDAQVTWDPTLSPSPSLGVTTVVTGNCGFGIVPSPPPLRDLIMRNLAVVEGMDLDALRAGIDWRFQSFAEYLDAVRRAGPYANVAVLVGHSAVRTAVMGEDASVRKEPTAAELAEMKRLVGEAMDQGAIGLGASYSPNHSGWGGIPMPSTISDISEFEALVGAMGGPGRGVVEIASGTIPVETIAGIAGRHGRRIFMTTGLSFYNEQFPKRGIGMFEACAAAQARGQEVYLQFTCQPLSFDFTLAAAYPFYSHPAFDPIKAYDREQLKAVFRDPSFRERFRDNLRNPRPGTIFQGNWDRVIVAAPVKPENAGLANRTIGEIARETGRDPLDLFLDLGLDGEPRHRVYRPLPERGRRGGRAARQAQGRGHRAVRRRRASRLSVRRRVRALPARPLGARARRVRSAGRRAPADQPPGRAVRHPRSRPHRGRRPCRSAAVRSGDGRRLAAAAGQPTCRPAARAPCATRSAFTASSSTASACSTARITSRLDKGPGQVLDRFLPARERRSRARRSKPRHDRTEMPVDPQIQALLDRGTGVPATHTLPVDVARRQYEARIALMAPPAEIAAVQERTIDGPGGSCASASTPHAAAGRFRCWCSFTAAALCCAASTRMTACAAICAPGPDASSSRSITAWRPSTNSRPGSRIA